MQQLAYQTAGNPGDSAVMLLHGFMSSNAQWLLNIEALSRHHFLVMVELWGHGNSPTPKDRSYYSIRAYLQQFERIRGELAIEHWSLIGQSYGAGLVVNYALQCPERCDAVVVTNSRSAFGKIEGQAAAPREKSQFNPRQLPFHPIHARRFPQQVKDALVKNADAVSAAAIKLGGTIGSELNSIDALGRLKQPLLMTNGRYETAFQADLDNLWQRYPNLNVAHLEGGHSVNIEAADGFNDAVLEFLEQVEKQT